MSEIVFILSQAINSMGEWQVNMAREIVDAHDLELVNIRRERLDNGRRLRLSIAGLDEMPSDAESIARDHIPSDIVSAE